MWLKFKRSFWFTGDDFTVKVQILRGILFTSSTFIWELGRLSDESFENHKQPPEMFCKKGCS